MAKQVRFRLHLTSTTLTLPELTEFIGKEVEIVVREVESVADDQTPTERYPLRGSVLYYDDPCGPAVPIEDWEALR